MINKKDLNELNIKAKGYKKHKNIVLLETFNNQKYIFKNKKVNLEKKFKYLKTRSFDYFPNYTTTTNYNIFEYVEDYDIPKEEKAKDVINLISILHLKTTHYKKIDIDENKKTYEEMKEKIEDLKEYFLNLNTSIEEEIYMSPSHYLLIRNISKIYANLEYCKNSLDDWYEKIKEKDKKRVVFVHNNLDLSHHIKNEKDYLISWDKSKFDSPIYDLYNFYKNNYKDIDFSILLKQYEQRYPLTEEEIIFLFLLISLPNKIEFINDDYINTIEVDNLLKYIYQTDKIILEYNANQ